MTRIRRTSGALDHHEAVIRLLVARVACGDHAVVGLGEASAGSRRLCRSNLGDDYAAARGPPGPPGHGVPTLRRLVRLSDSRDGLGELTDFEAVFSALANETRRHVLVVLNARCGALTSGEIADRIHHSWPTVTRHLGVLVDAGLVSVERQGRQRVYHL